jgi:hypothetical protein
VKASQTILGPGGLPFVDMSGDRAWLQRTTGDIVSSFQWIDLHARNPEYEIDGPVPCLCLFHAHRHVENGCYVIPQSAAYKYAKSDGSGPTMLFFNAVALATLELGFDKNDKAAMKRVMDVVLEGVADLIKMPGQQPDDLEVKRRIEGIEATVKVNGKIVHQELR